MQEPTQRRPHRLSEDLKELLATQDAGDITFGVLIDALGRRGFGFLILFLALPSALPVPAPGYSTPFGILLFIVGAQLVLGRTVPWLPAWAKKLKLKRRLADLMIGGLAKFFSKVEHLIKPRMAWTSRRGGLMFAGAIVMAMGALMSIPIPGTNTAPAMVIFLVGVALTERDGLLLMLATVAGVLAAALYAAILVAIFHFGATGVSEAKEIIKEWLR